MRGVGRNEGPNVTQNLVVEFLFSPGSRYSYLASSQISQLEHETGCRVDWRPVNGGDIRALRGHDPFSGEAVSGKYDWAYRERDALQWANYYGIHFREPPSNLDFADELSSTFPDPDHSVGESRFVILGRTESDRYVVVGFTERGDRIRLISARPMTRRERQAYESQG